MKKICYYSIILHNTPTVWRNTCNEEKRGKKYILVHIHTKMFLYNNQNPTSPRKLINTISVSKFYFVYLSSHKKKKSKVAHERRKFPDLFYSESYYTKGGRGVGKQCSLQRYYLSFTKSIQDKESVRCKTQNPATPSGTEVSQTLGALC